MVKDYPRVIVLLAAYNGMKYIEEQIQSIEQQENVRVSIVISVDLSEDDTYQWCCDYAVERSHVEVLPYGQTFGGAAPNFFRLIKDVDFTQYDYVAFSDQDDIWHSDKLSHSYQTLEKNGVDGYSANVIAYWSDGREKITNKAQAQRRYDYLFEPAGPGCTYVMKPAALVEFKELLVVKIKQVQDVALHDWFVYAFFRSKGYHWFIDPVPKMRYRQHEYNQLGINSGWRAILKRLELLKNDWYRQQVALISYLVMPESLLHQSKWSLLKNGNQLRRRPIERIMIAIFVLMGALS